MIKLKNEMRENGKSISSISLKINIEQIDLSQKNRNNLIPSSSECEQLRKINHNVNVLCQLYVILINVITNLTSTFTHLHKWC